MIEIEKLDQERRLWQIKNLLPLALVEQIIRYDWVAAKHEPGNLDCRRQITIKDKVQIFEDAVVKMLPELNRQLGTNFRSMFGQWWLDLEGFSCAMHTDGHLPNAMQIYWIAPGADYGTGFYHYKLPDRLKHQFLSVPNSGYIMLNHAESDGSQLLQWHAMLNKLGPGQIRVSSYHIMTS